MTSSQARKDIYDYLSDTGYQIEYHNTSHKDLSRLLKRYGKIAAAEELEQLKTRLTEAIVVGESVIKKNDPEAASYTHQLIPLKSMLKWTDGKLKTLLLKI